MKVLTAAQMREVDRRTIEMGIPGIILMENAAHAVVREMVRVFGSLSCHRMIVYCGKGNNGGDGLAIARLLTIHHKPAALHVILVYPESDFDGDAVANLKMLKVTGVPLSTQLPLEALRSTIVVDAVLGTGITGPPHGPALEAIRAINTQFPLSKVVSVDVPSGIASDASRTEREIVHADLTITFTAPKRCHVLPPNCGKVGELVVASIGSPDSLLELSNLAVSEPSDFRTLFAPRPANSHKGNFGHALIVGGASGKSGSVRMAGVAALKVGAGLVTVASEAGELNPDLMTHNLWDATAVLPGMNCAAIGPGLGKSNEAKVLLVQLLASASTPLVIDADGLNLLADMNWKASKTQAVLTPHPGEMARLLEIPVAEVEADRLAAVEKLARKRNAIVVLKGQRSLIATPTGRVWINPTGSPSMAKGGSGDVLTGLIAGLIAQHPNSIELAVRAAVYLHGLCGELGAKDRTELSLLASELVDYLPGALRVVQQL